MEMRRLLHVVAWLTARAGTRLGAAGAGGVLARAGEGSTADRAGRLVPVPREGLEQDVGRTLTMHWAWWLAVGIVLLILAAGYVRRKWRATGEGRPERLTRRGPR